MRNLILVVALLAVATAGLAACGASADKATVAGPAPAPASTTTPKQKDPADDAPRISLADAKAAFDGGNVVFIDTRSELQFKEEHVKGAINIPYDAPDSRFSEIPKGKKIIAYCS